MIISFYLLGCNKTYEPYIVHAYHKTQVSNPIKRFSLQDDIPELSDQWKEVLEKITEVDKKSILADNIKLLALEEKDGLWRLLMSIPPAQQPYFLRAITSFNQSEQATLLDAILYLVRQDENLIKVALSGDVTYLPVFEQIKLSNMLQNLKANEQALLTKLNEKLATNT